MILTVKFLPGELLKTVSSFLSQSILPSLLQNFTLALLTILIPLAIAVLSDAYQTRRAENKDFCILDLQTILDQVFDLKRLVLCTCSIFILLLFWENSSLAFKAIFLPIIFANIVLVMRIILRVYDLTKGETREFRLKHLRLITNTPDIADAWQSVWQSRNLDHQDEKLYFDIFAFKIDSFFTSVKQLPIADALLDHFRTFLDQRSIVFLCIRENVLSRIFSWHAIAWKSVTSTERIMEYHGIRSNLEAIIRRIEERSILEHEADAFFDNLHTYIQQRNDQEIYPDRLLKISLSQFLVSIEKCRDMDTIVDDILPQEWRISLSNIENPENPAAKIVLEIFVKWSKGRLANVDPGKIDLPLDAISRSFFPEVNPTLWAALLTCFFSPVDPEHAIASIIGRPQVFGLIGRTRTFFGDPNVNEIQKQEDLEASATFALAIKLFRNRLTTRDLDNYLRELRFLSDVYPINSVEESRRKRYLFLFDELLKIRQASDAAQKQRLEQNAAG